MEPRPVSVASEGRDRPLTDISDDRTGPRAYLIKQSQLRYKNKWNDARSSQAVPIHTSSNPRRNKSPPTYKPEYQPDVPGVLINKPVNELFADAVDNQNYSPIKKFTRYEDDAVNKPER